ncbi:MAG TPA: nucleotidyltransferase domain-containing protein [Gaiellaceae bacterium]|nr:nucleotidyltransferase domain-containing protein [Gaiellaceae bacterium]
MSEALAERARERERLLGLARSYLERLSRRHPVLAAAVVGSVARGDFNVWSDVDVVVVADGLPERAPERGRLLVADAPGGVQPVGYTPEELREALRRGNPLAREAVASGVVLHGVEVFRRIAADADG